MNNDMTYYQIPTMAELIERYGDKDWREFEKRNCSIEESRPEYALMDVVCLHLPPEVDAQEIYEDNKYLILEMAYSIVECGLIKPILARMHKINPIESGLPPYEYEVLPGYEVLYLAAVEAQRLDPRKGEMVNCMLIKNNHQHIKAMRQLALFG